LAKDEAMANDSFDEIAYPSGEMDLKRRVAGEILKLHEDIGSQPPDEELVGIIEWVFADIRTRHYQRIEEGRQIDVEEEVKKVLSEN
jgi:hypothetical protein